MDKNDDIERTAVCVKILRRDSVRRSAWLASAGGGYSWSSFRNFTCGGGGYICGSVGVCTRWHIKSKSKNAGEVRRTCSQGEGVA